MRMRSPFFIDKESRKRDTLEMFGYLVAIVAGLKALEWLFDKIIKFGNKSQKVEVNAQDIAKYKEQTDAEIAKIKEDLNKAHNYAQQSLEDLKAEIVGTLEEHKQDYIKEISEVKHSVSEMSSVYQQTVAVIELKIDNLEKKQDKHNSVIERTFKLEADSALHEEKIKVANNRIADLERKVDKE